MECMPILYGPLILEPESEQDWAKQHVLSEQLRQAENKQSLMSYTNSFQTRLLRRTPSQEKPRRTNPLLLNIPHPTSRISKKLITPTKNIRTPSDWEALLHNSMDNLRGTYANMPQPPAAPRPQPRRSSGIRPDFSGLNRLQMASRAMQMAAGCHPIRRRSQSEDSDGESSGSDTEMEKGMPVTPVSVEHGVMMNIDPRLFS